jgi:hypothetical protein
VVDNPGSIISDLDDSTQVPWLVDNDISLHRVIQSRTFHRGYSRRAMWVSLL